MRPLLMYQKFISVFCFFILAGGIASADEPLCIFDDGNAYCHRVTDEAETWEDTQTKCSAMGEGWHLAAIPSDTSETFISSNWARLVPDANGGAADQTEQLWFGAKYVPFRGDKWRWSYNTLEEVDSLPGFDDVDFPPPDDDEIQKASMLMSIGVNDSYVFGFTNPSRRVCSLCESNSPDIPPGIIPAEEPLGATPLHVHFTVGDGADTRYFHGFTMSAGWVPADLFDWERADKRCFQINGWLAKVDNDDLLDDINQEINSTAIWNINLWVGLHLGEWTWNGEETIGDYQRWPADYEATTGVGVLNYEAGDLVWQSHHLFMEESHKGLCQSVDKQADVIPWDGREGADGVMYEYRLTEEPDSWEDTRKACKSMDGDLVVIDADGMQEWLNMNLPRLGAADGVEFWIGASAGQEDDDPPNEDALTFTWVNGEDVEQNQFFWLNDDTPTGPGCVHVRFQANAIEARWVLDENCGDNNAKYGLCEIQVEVEPDDDGLSGGEIAAIAVSCTVVVGCVAAGGGYYAYNKKKEGQVGAEDKPDDLEANAGEENPAAETENTENADEEGGDN